MDSPNLPARVPPPPSPPSAVAIPVVPQEYIDPAISPWQIWSILWAYRLQSALIAVAVILLAVAAAVAWPRSYEATATLMVNFDVYDPLGGREFPIGLVGSYMATQVELARSTEVLLPVIERLQLTRDEDYTKGYKGPAAGLPLWVADQLRKKLSVEPGLYGSQLIYVASTARSAEQAAQIANMVADVYADQQYRRLTGPAKDRAQRYTEQLGELQGKVNSAQDEATTFRRRHQLIDSDMTGDVSLELLTQLEHRLQEIQQVRRVAEARAAGDATVGTEVLGSTMIQSLKTQLAAQNAQMASRAGALGSRHPEVLALQAQISATRQALNAEQRAYGGNVAAELAAARKLEAQVQTAVDEQRSKVANIREVQDDGAKYRLELQSAQVVYQRALEGYDQVMFAATSEYTNVDIVSQATAPTRPSKPRVLMLLFIGCVAGGGLGLFLPLAYELLNRRVRGREDIERDHGVPVLAELGSIRGKGGLFPVQYGH